MKYMMLPLVMFAVCLCNSSIVAQEKEAVQESEVVETTSNELKLADGKFQMMAPDAWKDIDPKSGMIEVEYKIPMADGDDSERDGRLTIMAAGGGVEANVSRWQGQFSQPDGSSTSDQTKVEEIEVNGLKVHMVDISGTFAERTRMTAPPTMRENYRMLAAIVETGSMEYFIKFYAGSKTVEANKEMFEAFIKSFKASE